MIVFSNAERGRILAAILGHCGLMPAFCSTLKEARRLSSREAIRLVFCEERLTDGRFDELLEETSARTKLPLIVVLSGSDLESHLEARQLGAFECIREPFSEKEINGIVHDALLSVPVRVGSRGQ